MSPALAFTLVFGAFGVACIVALVADSLKIRSGAFAAGALMLVGGGISLYHAWTSARVFAFDFFVVGGGYSATVGLVGALAGLALLTARTADDSGAETRRSGLIALGAVGAALAAQAADLVTLLLALEIAAAAGYALIASARTPGSAEAAMKYLIQGAVVTGLLVLGAAVLAGGYDAEMTYVSLAALEDVALTPFVLAILLVVAGLVFKAGGAPFHSWAPDAYQTAPTGGAAFLAGPVKLAMVCALATFAAVTTQIGTGATDPFGTLGARVLPIIGGLAVVSVVVGSFVALRQTSYTRMLAYAGIAQLGYALIAIASQSPSWAVLFMCTYAVATTGGFMASQAFSEVSPEWDGSIEGLAGIGRRAPVLGLAVSVIMMSLAGIPPLIGFWGKLRAFQSAVGIAMLLGSSGSATTTGYAVFYAALAFVGVGGSVVSLAYYGSVLRALYSPGTSATPILGPRPGQIAVVCVALLVVVGGVAALLLPFTTVVRGFLM